MVNSKIYIVLKKSNDWGYFGENVMITQKAKTLLMVVTQNDCWHKSFGNEQWRAVD